MAIDYIYESPDGGKTVTRRKFGEREKEIVVEEPLQIVVAPEIVAVGNGLTITVAVIGNPEHPLPDGVIV